jgi:hypothetical protein
VTYDASKTIAPPIISAAATSNSTSSVNAALGAQLPSLKWVGWACSLIALGASFGGAIAL